MHMISWCESTTRVLPYGRFLTRVFKDVGVDLGRETDFEAPNAYDMYDDQSMGRMKFEKVPDGSQVRKAERTPIQAQGQVHPGVEEEVEIREMKGGLDPQSGFQQRDPKLDIPLLQSKGIRFEATFSKPMMSEPTYTMGPSTQLTFTEPHHTVIPPHQTPLTPNHAPWMDLFTQISSLGTRMEDLAIVSDSRFYSMEDHMDQYQAGFTSRFERIEDHMDQHQAAFTSQFKHFQQKIERIEDRLESQHKEMMAYLCSVFPPPPPQP